MNVTEFEHTKAAQRCLRCGHVGLDTYRPANGNHVGARCSNCGSKSPLTLTWFSQNGSAQHIERPRQSAHDVRETWELWGDFCAFCGKSWTLCERLHIGRTVQHVYPITLGGAEDSSVIPFCARCQEMSRAALLETLDVMREIKRLEGE